MHEEDFFLCVYAWSLFSNNDEDETPGNTFRISILGKFPYNELFWYRAMPLC